MKARYAAVVLIVLLLSAGCVSQKDTAKWQAEGVPLEGGQGSISIKLMDEDTGTPLEALAEIRYTYELGPCEECVGNGGSIGYSNNSVELKEMDFGKYGASAVAEGYSMSKFEFIVKSEKNEVTTALKKGVCQNTCENISEVKRIMEDEFGLRQGDYMIECSECLLDRGGYIKARIARNGEPKELFYKWGWCSSGGSDCGWDACFTSFLATKDSLYESVKSRLCGRVSSKQVHDELICTGKEFDTTEEAKNDCLAGKFEETGRSNKTISISQVSNRCASFVKKGKAGCFEN